MSAAAEPEVNLETWRQIRDQAVTAIRSLEAVPVPPLALIWYATLDRAVTSKQLVRKLLMSGSLFVVYGESNSGKTYFIIDLALHIAAGLPWRGFKVDKGLVFYVAGEGAASIRNRVAAFKLSNIDVSPGIPFAIVPAAVNFLDPQAVDMLIQSIQAAEAECGEKVVLVIVDTLARALIGGNENDARDMGFLVSSADRIRAETGAAVGFIHHAGKDAAKGARGHSSLRAACDTEIIIEGLAGTRTATVCKQRDMESGASFAFDLVAVPVGEDEDGTTITSCIVKVAETTTVKAKPKGKNQQKAVTALMEWSRANPTQNHISSVTITELLTAQRLDRHRRSEVLQSLVSIRVLTPAIGGYTIDPEMLP